MLVGVSVCFCVVIFLDHRFDCVECPSSFTFTLYFSKSSKSNIPWLGVFDFSKDGDRITDSADSGEHVLLEKLLDVDVRLAPGSLVL